MSIYIKGMEMPEICDMCPLLAFIEEDEDHDAFCYCILSNWKKSCTPDPMTIREVRRFRRLDCPLIEVPPHGKLIDADALENEAQMRLLECNKYDNQFQKPYEVMRAIALVPTIIPAEKD